MDPGRMRIRIRNTEWRINALQQHYQARRQAEQDEEVSSAPQSCNEEAMAKPRV
jgi:hypothetical protein